MVVYREWVVVYGRWSIDVLMASGGLRVVYEWAVVYGWSMGGSGLWVVVVYG